MLIAVVMAVPLHLSRIRIETRLPLYYVAIQTGFFIVLRFIIPGQG
jgi:hypothetical protein